MAHTLQEWEHRKHIKPSNCMRVIIFVLHLVVDQNLKALAHNIIITVKVYDDIWDQILFLLAIFYTPSINRPWHELYVRFPKILPSLHRLQEFRLRLVNNCLLNHCLFALVIQNIVQRLQACLDFRHIFRVSDHPLVQLVLVYIRQVLNRGDVSYSGRKSRDHFICKLVVNHRFSQILRLHIL
jgi:hypothetical protein